MDNTASSYKNPLWKSFYIPNDKITDRFKVVLDDFENLPASFYYKKDIKESFGLPLLELKKGLTKPIKETPLLSKLINGDYQTEKSQSDYKIVKDIKFFINNFPSFNKYKNTDDLSFIINDIRLLLLELFEYYKDKNASLKTLEGRLVGILRVFFIAFKNKQYFLYQKLSIMMLDLLFSHKQDEDKQELNRYEQERFIPFEIIIQYQKDLLEQYRLNPTYKNNQDLLLVSLYRYLPERDELKELKFSTTKKTDDDYIYFDKDDDVILLLNKSKKKHKELHLNLSEDFKELAEIIKESYKTFKRTNVFTDYNDSKKSISIQGLYKRMINLFSFTGKRVGVSILRSSYLTYQAENKRLSVADKKRLAVLMRTRKDKIDEAYIKILPKEEKQEILNDISLPDISLKQKSNTYNKQLINNKIYYNKNRERIIERVKKNQSSKPKEEINRKRILYYLNGDEDYINKVKPETLTKYKIILKNDRWV